MKIAIIGLGWFGLPLGKKLVSKFKVCGTTRSQEKSEEALKLGIKSEVVSHPDTPSIDLLKSDIVILNIPPFEKQLGWFKSWPWQKSWMIFISSTGKSPEIALEEEWVKTHFDQWTILRFGGLLGNGRHPGKSLSGRKNLPGKNWPVNLIHQDDIISITEEVIEQKIQNQVITVVCDEHPTREEFYTDYCKRMNLPLPEFDPNDLSEKPIIGNDELKKFYKDFKSLRDA